LYYDQKLISLLSKAVSRSHKILITY
jgi:hypothetical protein